jgi:hypothetical protein
LDREQLGHVRHFDNLSRNQRNDWSLMQGKGMGQEDFGGYRFQLAYMAYALALTHRHRLPAAPGLVQPMIQRLIGKILEPEVWLYWRDVSRGGAPFNAHLVDRLGEEWNPVGRDNIMYSAYVQSMASLHDYLFGDDRYAQPDSLTFRHWSPFWGGPEKQFAYDRDSLNDHLYWLMVENGYIGVACEPNCVFQICNQPAILGFRLHDLITGGALAVEVVEGYERAWADFGRLDADGHYNMMVLEDSRKVRPNESGAPWVDAWCGALMNMWNSEFVRRNYPRQITRFAVAGEDGLFTVPPQPPGPALTDTCDFGWVTAWTSEMGDAARRDGLLAHADRYMSPAWLNGGLYYPRNDVRSDVDGHRVEIEPMTGNVLLGYARLNVPDGLRGLYNEPWSKEHFEEPALTAVERDIDVSRAEVVDGVLLTRLRRRTDLPAAAGDGTVTISRVVGRGRRRLSMDGAEIAEIDGTTVRQGDGVPPGTVGVDARGRLVLRCPDGGHKSFELARVS